MTSVWVFCKDSALPPYRIVHEIHAGVILQYNLGSSTEVIDFTGVHCDRLFCVSVLGVLFILSYKIEDQVFHCCCGKRGQSYSSPCQLFRVFFFYLSFFKIHVHYNPESMRRSLSGPVITFNYKVSVAGVRSEERDQ